MVSWALIAEWLSPVLGNPHIQGSNPVIIRNILRIKFFILKSCACVLSALKIFLRKLAILVIIVAAQRALNSFKTQYRFAYCALGLQIAFWFCGTTFLKWRAHLW
jgi:hypothetical protein